MRILFVTRHIHFPQGGGGAERNTHELCLALTRKGHDCAVLCSLSANRTWLSYSNRIKRRINPRLRFPCDRKAGYPVFRGWYEDGIAEVKARFNPTVAIVQGTEPDIFVSSIEHAGIPAFIYIHEVEKLDHLATLAGKVPFIANSAFTAQRLHRACGIGAAVVLPIVEPSYYRMAVTPERVLFVNTVPRKGLEIAFQLAESRRDIPFDFVRAWILNPEETAALQRRADAAGNIRIHEPTSNMRPLYARARLLLAPSQWEETWGRVVTEAHINGIPVLASNTGGLPQSVGLGGICLPRCSRSEAWLHELADIWDNSQRWKALSEAARAHAAREEIKPDTIVDRLLAVLGTTQRRASA